MGGSTSLTVEASKLKITHLLNYSTVTEWFSKWVILGADPGCLGTAKNRRNEIYSVKFWRLFANIRVAIVAFPIANNYHAGDFHM